MNRNEAFGIVVRQERNRRGWSQELLAGKVGVTRRFIFLVETNVHSVSLNNVFKLADAFGIHTSELLAIAEDVANKMP
jgi:transcriptional regulator with XRE-family HTH domain